MSVDLAKYLCGFNPLPPLPTKLENHWLGTWRLDWHYLCILKGQVQEGASGSAHASESDNLGSGASSVKPQFINL